MVVSQRVKRFASDFAWQLLEDDPEKYDRDRINVRDNGNENGNHYLYFLGYGISYVYVGMILFSS